MRCNLCGWWGAGFLADRFHPGTVCPRCGSHVRHRLVAAALTWSVPEIGQGRLVDGRSVLHFAPEEALAPLLRARAARYVDADLLAPGYDYDVERQLDITDMASVADGAFELVVACDVLEHVPDDRAALVEVHRVLADGGSAVFTVPQQDGLEVTFEDPTATTFEDRERRFGQGDHLRIYGADVVARLEGAGFRVVVVDHAAFPARSVRRHVLFPPVRSPHPLATNHRRVFVAQRR